MKAFIYSYLLCGIWLGLEIAYLRENEWHHMIAAKPWGFVVVNAITFFPILLILFVADRLRSRPSGHCANDE